MDCRKKALITGASGFIGSHLAAALKANGWHVAAMVRPPTETARLEPLDIQFIHADYSDEDSLITAVEGMDYVFHLGAALNAPNWETFNNANALATERLLSACAVNNPGLKKFVYVSSIAASGPSPRGKKKTENDPCTPVSLYGRSKLAGEECVHRYRSTFPVVIVRPPNVLGPRQKELTTVIALIKKRILPLLGNGDKQTSICFVDDLVRALILAADKDLANGRTYFVTDNREYSWQEIVCFIAREVGVAPFVLKIHFPLLCTIAALSEWISKLTGKTPLLNRQAIVSVRKYYWLFDSKRIEEDLGFSPKVSFEEGIKNIIQNLD